MTVSSTDLVDALRRSLTENERLRGLNAELADRAREPIAIVSMGCRLPGGVRGPDDLWTMVDGAQDATSEIPADRPWKQALRDGLGDDVRPRGGFVAGIDRFDPSLFGIAPREATAMDPQQRMLLETAWETFERAGVVPATLRGTATGVFVGGAATGYATHLQSVPDGVGPYMVTGTSTSVLSGRLAYVFGLEGPAITLDTACSSSLVAVHQAVQALRRGDCELALAGGVSVMSTAGTFLGFSASGVMARDGRCKAFSAHADGAGWAEGAALLLVERLSDAQRNGHPVLAVIRGSAVNSDGASNGLTAPNGPSQQRVIRAALADAGLRPGDVDVVEAHGTGTRLGDPIEAQALQSIYGRGRPTDRPLLLGSLKSNVGHTQAASGAAGIVKTVLALAQAHVPASLFGDEPSPHIDWAGGGVELCGAARAWPETGRPRRAAVSSFGISGTNAHVVIEQAPASTRSSEPVGVRVLGDRVPLIVSATSPGAVAAQAAALRDLVAARPDIDIEALAATSATARTVFGHRAVATVADSAQAHAELSALAEGTPGPATVAASATTVTKTVFVFPGQGGQCVGMARELLRTSTDFTAAIAECDQALRPHLGTSVVDVLVGDDDAWLERVEIVQPALWAVMVALARRWMSHGLTPAAVVGHSQGEIAAACIAGALSIDDGARIVALRAAAVAQTLAGHGAMASVALPVAEVAARLGASPEVQVAAVNGPSSTVVAGEPRAVDDFVSACAADGARVRVLAVDYASHTDHVDALRDRLAADLGPIRPRTGSIPFFSTVTAAWRDTATLDAGYWFDNLRRPVRLDESVSTLLSEGFTGFVEVGPHPVLAVDLTARFEADVDPAAASPVVVSTLRRDERADRRFATAVGEAITRGLPMDRQALFGGIMRMPASELPSYSFADERYWLHAEPDPSHHDRTRLADAGLSSTDHPLLGAAVAVAGRDEYLLTGRLAAADHVPPADGWGGGIGAADLLEVMLRAADEVGAGGLSDAVIVGAVTVPENAPVDLQVRVGAAATDGAREVTVHARAGGVWTKHAHAVAVAVAPTSVTPAGGTGHPVVLDAAREADADRYVLHPALLAGAVDVLYEGAELSTIASIAVLRTGAVAVAVAASGSGDTRGIVLTDTAGEVVAVLDGVTTRPAGAPGPTAAEAGERTAFRRGWVPCPPALTDVGDLAWAVVGPGDRPVAAQLRAAGRVVAEGFTLSELVGGTPFSRVLLDLTADNGVGGIAGVAGRARDVAGAALAAAQTLLTTVDRDDVALVAVTRGAVAVTGGDAVADPGAAAVWGLFGSASIEHPGRFAVIDIGSERAVDPRFLDRGGVADEPRTAVRAGVLLAARLQPVDTDTPASVGRTVDPRKAVVVTGGTGMLGALVAQHLVAVHGVRDVVLTGRRGPDAPGAAALQADLAAAGASVDVVACDVGDPVAVTAMLADLGRPVGVLVHAAGTTADAAVTGLGSKALEETLAPKIGGLAALIDGCPDAQIVLFSSVAGVLGSPGQANYAAANAVLDATAEHLRAGGRGVVSTAWGLWDAVSELTAQLGDVARRRLAAMGTRPITTAEGLEFFDRGLDADGLPAVGVLFPLTVGRTPVDAAMVPAMLRGLVPTARRRPAAAATSAPAATGGLRGRLATTPPARRVGVVLGAVRTEVAAVLGYADADAVAPDRPYLELGLDSVTMLDLRNRLGSVSGTTLGITDFYDHPTPLATASWLVAGQLGQGLPAAGDAVTPCTTVGATGPDTDRVLGPKPSTAIADDPIVIVSTAVRVPGGVETPDAFWQMLDTGEVGVGDFPDDRGWDQERFASFRAMLPGIEVLTHGGFISGASGFDAELFGITPDEALVMDPQQRLLLELAWETFERAGIDPRRVTGERVGVYLGTFFQNYINDLRRVPEASMPYVSTAGGAPFACARVAYAFGLDGPTLTVDTGCSSSAIALHLATQAVRTGECTSALVGGITVMAFPAAFPDLGGASPDGRCRSFSTDADGTGWGEGAGMVLVERMSQARRHGHTVLSVVRGSAVNHNGSGNGLSAPNGPSQRAVIERALDAAGLGPNDVDAVEGHGTGTLLGDEIEAEALIAAYGRDRNAQTPLLLGSTKGNTGHPHAASGVLGVIAATLMLHSDALPAVAHPDNPLPRLDGSAGVRLRTTTTPWPRSDRPRRIGVSSFGGSGSKAHIVLEQAPQPARVRRDGAVPDTEVAVCVSAATVEALGAAAARLRDAVGRSDDDLACIAATLGVGRAALRHRAVIVTADRAVLTDALDAVVRGDKHAALRQGVVSDATTLDDRIAFAFTDIGSDADGSLAEVFGAVPAFAAERERTRARLTERLGRPIDPLVHPVPDAYADTVAAAAAFAALGVVPDIVIGAGTGAFAAAVVSGLLDADDAAAAIVAVATGAPLPEVARRLPRVPCLTPSGADLDPTMRPDPDPDPAPAEGDIDGVAELTVTMGGGPISTATLGGGTHPHRRRVGLLAEIWRHGIPVDWSAMYARIGDAVADLPTYPFDNRSFWLGATGDVVAHDDRVEPDEDKRKAVICEYYRRLNGGDVDGVVAMFAADGRIEDPLGQPPAEGHEALRRFFDITIRLGDIRDTVHSVVAAHDGRHIAAAVTADMVNVQDPDRARVTVEAVMTFQVDGRGLITEARTFWGASDVTFGGQIDDRTTVGTAAAAAQVVQDRI